MKKYHLKGPDCAACSDETAAVPADFGHLREEEPVEPRQILRIAVSAVLFAVGIVFNGRLHDTPYSLGEYAVLLPAYLLVGYPVLKSALIDLIQGKVFGEMFLMAVATGGALFIHQIPEAVGVMLFFSVGEYLQDLAVERSRKSISQLMSLRPEFARICAGEERRIVEPEKAAVGDIVEVRPGERVPLDGEVVKGEAFVDTSSLTGESVPRSAGPGDALRAGYVVEDGALFIRVTAVFGQSAVARILDLVENASANKAPTEKFMNRFAAVYTPAVVGLAAAIAVLPPLLVPGASFSDWAYRALILLVISCPCALVVSIPLGYFGGIGAASRHKLLVKGANYLDALRRIDTVVFDKTGTLTKGSFEVTDVVARNGFSREDILRFAAAAESLSTHPIARSIKAAAGEADAVVGDIRELKGRGVLAVVDGHSILAGNDRLLHEENVVHGDCDAAGTVVHVVIDGVYAGHILISDLVKGEARPAMRELKAEGVRRLIMLTGDGKDVAKTVAETLGIDEYYAELLPQDKVARLEALEAAMPRGKKIVFVGDGMNDAPVLMRADIGFAMGGLGSDAAIAAADVVIMDDHVARVPLAMRIAKFTHRIVAQNIVLALGVKGAFLLLGAAGEANMWEAVIADVGVTLLAVLNSLRAARYSGS